MNSHSRLEQDQRHTCLRLLRFTLICCLLPLDCFAQQPPAPEQSPAPQKVPALPNNCEFSAPGRCVVEIAKDQTGILTSPFRMRKKDLLWLVPVAAATGAAFAFDRKVLDQVSTDPSRVNALRQTSNITGIYVPLATIGTTWIAGAFTHNDHLRETGLLSAEALADTMLFTSFVKYGTNRVRPRGSGLSAEPGETGEFWPDGRHYPGGDSFPSGHTAVAFAFAHVVADEYPGWKIKLAVYSLAAATAAERVGGREHFPSDVLVGGALGYLIGGYVYNHHSASSKNHLTFSPIVGGKTLGVSLHFSRSHDDDEATDAGVPR